MDKAYQPLWGWPIGLVVFGAAVVAAVMLLRWVFSLLPPEFGKVFERYLDVLVGLQPLWIFVALIAVPIWLGAYLSHRWRMPDYSGKIAVVGHTPQRDGKILDLGYLKCIDTFCVGGGWLTALDTDTGQFWQATAEGQLRS